MRVVWSIKQCICYYFILPVCEWVPMQMDEILLLGSMDSFILIVCTPILYYRSPLQCRLLMEFCNSCANRPTLNIPPTVTKVQGILWCTAMSALPRISPGQIIPVRGIIIWHACA